MKMTKGSAEPFVLAGSHLARDKTATLVIAASEEFRRILALRSHQ